ncbi:cytochrome C assembly protein [Labilibaculum filiforme]|uniref:Cytochrome C assembly protein n=1 Tax=Labilibaculum filiforme TaxID=1940526 RepID=A0A2N3I5I9_9BACT|nr:cytochrome c biogenesis protein CcsA [Labilibaculum filiforme]PKQ65577.1 cytochrome C assembly protein [Labilibaculum filiforme]
MIWSHFLLAAGISTGTWVLAVFLPKRVLIRNILVLAGIASIAIFIAYLWFSLERPPLRTLGETRLWYAFFLPIIGFLTYWRWRYNWMLYYSLGLSLLFLFINYLHPENFSKTLMPALQSPWFVPHVVVYIFAYAFLAASSLVAVRGLYQEYKSDLQPKVMLMADNLVYLGFAFLTLGLLFGALWAKEAWGHYWTWDPKETWAFITWLGYLVYIHRRFHMPAKFKSSLWILALAFVILLICWFGVNYLPSAQFSVHTYSQQP